MTKIWTAILAIVFVATFSWAADSDQDGVLDQEDAWPNNSSLPKLSSAWGAYGESWSPSSTLGFHGFAGYHDGEDLPSITRIIGRVTDHGATGNDTSDDTQAFQNAISAANSQVSKDNPGVLLIPAGDYYISQQLMLDTPGLVLRGEGRNATTLHSSVLGAATIQVGDGVFDWEYEEHWVSDLFTKLDNNNLPQRGDTEIRLASALSSTYYNNLKAQNFRACVIQTVQTAPSSATPQLMENLYGGAAVLSGSNATLPMRQVVEVSVSSDKKTLYLDRPLRFSPSSESIWNRPATVCLRDVDAATEDEEIGVEDLTVIIANRDYSTHFMPNETTGISFEACHSWAKNLRVHNADVSVFTHNGSHNNTIKDIEITADRDGVLYGNYQHIPTPWQYVYGHYAVALMGFDNLADIVSVDKPRIHDTSFGMTQGCVYSRISGTEINFDHHRLCPYDNLATEIDIGDPYRMWSSSGDDSEGWRTAADNVYWGLTISTTNTLYWPGMDPWMEGRWGYYRNSYIATGMPQDPNDGFLKDGKTMLEINPDYDPNDVHFEGMSPSELFPQNLYFAQRKAYFAGNLQCPGREVNVTHNDGGSIMPDGIFHVPNAGTPKYFFEVKPGYRIDKVLVNGQDQGALTEYAFSGITADSTLEVVFVSTNAAAVAPVANFTATPSTGMAPLPVSFDGSGSADDGQIVSYDWDFTSNGTFVQTTVATNSYTYSAAGSYTAMLVVTDNLGLTGTNTVTVSATPKDFPAGSGTGGIRRDRWNSISGTALSDLTGLSSYPNASDANDVLATIDYTTLGDNYGILLRGYLHAPVTGQYSFYIASDDASELRISSDSDPVNAVAIVGIAGWISQYNYTTTTQPLSLVAGQQYYIEVLHKEGGGGDHLAVAWSAPGYNQSIIEGQYLSPFMPDSDGDGLTDAQEVALDTDPNDPDSGFGIDGSTLPGIGKIEIIWPSATGVLYKVWNSPDLDNWSVTRDWTNALTPPEDALEIILSPSNGFFKVEAEIQ